MKQYTLHKIINVCGKIGRGYFLGFGVFMIFLALSGAYALIPPIVLSFCLFLMIPAGIIGLIGWMVFTSGWITDKSKMIHGHKWDQAENARIKKGA